MYLPTSEAAPLPCHIFVPTPTNYLFCCCQGVICRAVSIYTSICVCVSEHVAELVEGFPNGPPTSLPHPMNCTPYHLFCVASSAAEAAEFYILFLCMGEIFYVGSYNSSRCARFTELLLYLLESGFRILFCCSRILLRKSENINWNFSAYVEVRCLSSWKKYNSLQHCNRVDSISYI